MTSRCRGLTTTTIGMADMATGDELIPNYPESIEIDDDAEPDDVNVDHEGDEDE